MMNIQNPAGCIFPACSCKFRCADLFEDAVPDLRGGLCAICRKPATVYKSSTVYICKSCLAEQSGLRKKEPA